MPFHPPMYDITDLKPGRAIQIDGEPFIVDGTCEGKITRTPRGSGGFGYDPLFLVDGTDKTMAELPELEKNRISHRARAAEKLRLVLEKAIAERDATTRKVAG